LEGIVNKATLLHHRMDQERFRRLITDPNFYIPMGLLQLMSSFAVVSSGWSLNMIVQFYLVLPAVVAFGALLVVSHVAMIGRTCRNWNECGGGWRTLTRPHWAWVLDALLIGFFAGLLFLRWAQTLSH
jgi:hypothetical protein